MSKRWYEEDTEESTSQTGFSGSNINMTPDQLKSLVEQAQNPGGGFDLGRMILSGLGAALGSRYETLGAAAGGAGGSAIWDLLKKLGIRQ